MLVSVLVAGLTTVAVLALAVTAHDGGTLDRVLIATLALLALSSFDAVLPLPAAARELSETIGAGKRVLDLVDREAAVRDPIAPEPRGEVRSGRARRSHGALPGGRDPRARRLRPTPGSRTTHRSRRPERRWEDDGHEPSPTLPRSRRGAGHDRRTRHS